LFFVIGRCAVLTKSGVADGRSRDQPEETGQRQCPPAKSEAVRYIRSPAMRETG
jgi:hypothetical protein